MIKRLGIGILFFHCSFAVFAAQCPEINEIYRYEGGVIKPYAPSGWMFGSKHKLDSNNIRFLYATWAKQRIDPRDERRVLCIYGNPDWAAHGVILETVNIIDESLVSEHSEWVAYGQWGDYYRCNRTEPSLCPFG